MMEARVSWEEKLPGSSLNVLGYDECHKEHFKKESKGHALCISPSLMISFSKVPSFKSSVL